MQSRGMNYSQFLVALTIRHSSSPVVVPMHTTLSQLESLSIDSLVDAFTIQYDATSAHFYDRVMNSKVAQFLAGAAVPILVVISLFYLDQTAIRPTTRSLDVYKRLSFDLNTSSAKENQPILPINISAIPKELQHPKLIIGGAQKGGTTALWGILKNQRQFLRHHPGCRQSPELHFFDKIVPDMDIVSLQQNVSAEEWNRFQQDHDAGLTDNVTQALRKKYASCWKFGSKPEEDPDILITLEKTPIYMVSPGLPKFLKQVAPWVKILFIVREPVARAYSSWKMHQGFKSNKADFDTSIREEIETLRRQGLTTAPSLEEYTNQLTSTETTDFNLPLSISERRPRRSHYQLNITRTYLYRGMYAELLGPWMEYFELGKDLLVVSHERFSEDHMAVVNEIQRFMGVQNVTTNISETVLAKNYHGGYQAAKMNATTKMYLEEFFRPYNLELAELLGEKWYGNYVGEKWISKNER